MPRRLVAGLVPAAVGTRDPELRRALHERERLLEHRADALARLAIAERPPWLKELGPSPSAPDDHGQWARCVATIAAYRERHDITSSYPLGDNPAEAGYRDARLAFEALRRAQHLSGLLTRHGEGHHLAKTPRSGVGR